MYNIWSNRGSSKSEATGGLIETAACVKKQGVLSGAAACVKKQGVLSGAKAVLKKQGVCQGQQQF
jgi:hypothetical protein